MADARTARRPKIIARLSSVTSQFVRAIIPYEVDLEKSDRLLAKAGSKPNVCIYCEREAKTWDHLYPLVRNKRPSGSCHTEGNLVPSCHACNSSKGSKFWKEWINSVNAGKRGIEGDKLHRVYERLNAFDDAARAGGTWSPEQMIQLVGDEDWQEYFKIIEEIDVLLHKADNLAEGIASRLNHAHKRMRIDEPPLTK